MASTQINVQASTATNPIQFISLISRSDELLYIQSFQSASKTTAAKPTHSETNRFLRFNFFSHMALDIFLSPTSLALREQQSQQQGDDQYDGVLLLFIQDQVMVYGYESNNGLKIIVGVDQAISVDVRRLRKLINDVYRLYLRILCNPFRNFGKNSAAERDESGAEAGGHEGETEILKGTKFDSGVESLVESFV
ncbi:uncharacterized protein LODBEIA_P39590 [Lodderomyces beijingensis]|uniref:Sedlin n=1 Tax=Lodderomyces beijingensis TaxID=1775926 RepID=A0ABP0ZU88_9ASCO